MTECCISVIVTITLMSRANVYDILVTSCSDDAEVRTSRLSHF